MGLTHVATTIKNPLHPKKQRILNFLVDSGATYSVVPASILQDLGIKPNRELEFVLADGTTMSRKVGNVLYEFQGIEGAAPVVFGQPDDSLLLGAVTLESLGLILDPFKRQLHPLKTFMV